jgi:hypothetical protein
MFMIPFWMMCQCNKKVWTTPLPPAHATIPRCIIGDDFGSAGGGGGSKIVSLSLSSSPP